jgi:hypothetical protein
MCEIRELQNGQALLVPDVGVAHHLRNGFWRVRTVNQTPVWDSVFRPGKKTNVKFVKSKAEAKHLLRSLTKCD